MKLKDLPVFVFACLVFAAGVFALWVGFTFTCDCDYQNYLGQAVNYGPLFYKVVGAFFTPIGFIGAVAVATEAEYK